MVFMKDDNFIISFIAAAGAFLVGLLVAAHLRQEGIYAKCLEAGHTVQMCKEITE
jgi:hypothetical protein